MDRTTLLTAVNHVMPAVGESSTLPILSNLLVRDGFVYATDYQIRIKAPLSYTGEAFTAPGKLFRDLVRSLPEGELELALKRNALAVSCCGVRSELATMPAKDFPEWPTDATHKIAELTADQLDTLLSVAWAVPTKDPRPQLQGIHLVAADGKLTAQATDGKRAAWMSVACEGANMDCIVPLSALKAVAGHVVSMYAGDNCVVLETAEFTVYSRTIEGKYPDIAKVIPKKFNATLTIPVRPLIDAMRRAKIFTGVSGLDIVVTDGAASVVAEMADVGSFSEAVPGVEGDDVTISINPDYLISALSQSGDTETIRCVTNGALLVDDRALVMQIKRGKAE